MAHLGPARHWAGKKFVGIPFLNSARHESQPFSNREADWIVLPQESGGGSFSGVPGATTVPAGLEFLPIVGKAYRPLHPCRIVGTVMIRLMIQRQRVNLRSGFLYGGIELTVCVNGRNFNPTVPGFFAQHRSIPPNLFNRCINKFTGAGFDENFNNLPLLPDGG